MVHLRLVFTFLLLVLANISFAADVDLDGMEDSWEALNGLDTSVDDSGLDPDGDYLNNLKEFTSATDPQNPDSDGDWVKDGYEVFWFSTDPNKKDTDDDGVLDFVELINTLDPLDPNDVGQDIDNDGLTAAEEVNIHRTKWKVWDTDDDKLPDGWEVDSGLNPKNAGDAQSDTDIDGFTAYEEFRLGSDPQDTLSVPDYLPLDYFESFEDPDSFEGPVSLWQSPDESTQTWVRRCDQPTDDASCYLRSRTSRNSATNFMARFPAGSLSFAWFVSAPGNTFSVTLDGVEVFSSSGDGGTDFSDFEFPVTDGVHEIVISRSGPTGTGTYMIVDSVQLYPEMGLGVRPSNTACIAPPIDNSGTSIILEHVWRSEIPFFSEATKLLQAPGDGSRWFVLEKSGRVKVFDVDNPSDIRVYLDFSDDVRIIKEAGLLSMAFDPAFPAVPELYVSYASADNTYTLSRIVLDNTDVPDVTQEERVLTFTKYGSIHYSGDLAFGPDDNMLYMTIGDSNNSEWARTTTNFFGSMIRIDVRGVPWPSPGYNIPAGNAFPSTNQKCGPTDINAENCPEIFAWGFRNGWRFSIDSETGIWLGDVGWDTEEEIDRVVVGGNYGWPCVEGNVEGPLYAQCTAEELASHVAPVATYNHEEGRAVTGGYVYRGSAIPELYGHYVFSDLGRGAVWELVPDGNDGFDMREIGTTAGVVPSFGVDHEGELYLATYYVGGFVPPPLLKIVPGQGGPVVDPVATLLSETGCFDSDDPTLAAEGLIPYGINALFWSDNAVKSRHMAIPDGTTISINGENDWDYPVGSVLAKDFRLNGKLIETRLMMNRLNPQTGSGEWEGFSYEWDDNETEATRVSGAKHKTIDGQDWLYPSSAQCLACHTDAAGGSLGPETAQLNMDYQYPGSSGLVNQVAELSSVGMFASPVGDVSVLPALADPFDPSESLESRARAYLHTNCAQCHRPGTGVPSDMDFRYATSLQNTNTCDLQPQHGELEIGSNARLIAPGDPDSSIVLNRMSRRDSYGMPKLGSSIPDVQGAQLLHDWITSLESCGP